jgi:hypothetical protein
LEDIALAPKAKHQRRLRHKEKIMSTFIRSAIFAAAVLAGLAAAEARSYDLEDNARPLSSYDLNNPHQQKQFWDRQHQGN